MDIYSDATVRRATGQPDVILRDRADGAPPGAVVDAIRDRPDLRERFPDALSAGRRGAFARWLERDGWRELGLPGGPDEGVEALFAADPARSALLIVQSHAAHARDAKSRTDRPIRNLVRSLVPGQRRWDRTIWGADGVLRCDATLARLLFAAVARGVLSREAAWWCLIELREDPSRGVVWSWLLRADWQTAHPLGITRFGRRAFAEWIGREWGVAADLLDAERWVEPLGPADQLRLLLRRPEWRARQIAPLHEGNAARTVLAIVAVEHPEPDARRWMGRLDHAALADELARPGLNVLGHFTYPSGLGTSAAALLDAARAAVVPVSARNVPVGPERDEVRTSPDQSSGWLGVEAHDVTVAHVQPEPFFGTARERAGLVRDGAAPYRIGYWYWELDTIPPEWDAAAEACDELWTATRFVAGGLRRRYGKPVHAFLPGLRPPEPVMSSKERARERFGLPPGAFAFLFTFHMASVMERKNPLGLIEAFRRAFGPADDAVLVIKTSLGTQHPGETARLRETARGLRVHIIDAVLSPDEMAALTGCCDAYASLHRSEGLGLTIAEAMIAGLPAIATRYSGNLDFMDDDNALLVDCDVVELERDHGPYRTGMRWADPSIEDAARHMRRLYDDPAFAARLGQGARADLERRMNLEETGRAVRARLREIAARQAR